MTGCGKSFHIGRRRIAAGEPVFIVAEAGVNHNGDPETALALVREAGKCGADGIKFQTFKAERVASVSAPKAAYQLETTDPGESQLDMLRRLELPPDCYPDLMAACKREGLLFLSTPYSAEDVAFLESVGVAAYKVASALAVEPVFLREVARTGKPVFLSTGMCTLAEVDRAVRTLRQAGNDRIVLLQCTTNYPSPVGETNLKAMTAMGRALDVLAGYSDHTPSFCAAVAATALGACVLERHFTLDKSLPGPDQSSSSDPAEMTALVGMIRETEAALGSAVKQPGPGEARNITGMRRGLFAAADIPAGAAFSLENMAARRPCGEINADRLDEILGRRAAMDIPAGAALTLKMVQ